MPREFHVGDWLVQPQRNLITKPDQQVKLEPRAMDVLVYLAEHANEVISKGQLVQSVWGGNFVTDEALTYAIHELRKALGDDAKDPRFIQTFPKKGYQLIGLVAPPETETLPETPTEGRRQAALRVLVALVVGVSIGVTGFWWHSRGGRSTVRHLAVPVPSQDDLGKPCTGMG